MTKAEIEREAEAIARDIQHTLNIKAAIIDLVTRAITEAKRVRRSSIERVFAKHLAPTASAARRDETILRRLYDTERKLPERNFAHGHSYEEWLEKITKES